MSETKEDVRWEAQQLVFEAEDARSNEAALRLLDLALARDPECVDALLMKARLECRYIEEYALRLTGIVALAERQLGASFFDENRGQFWLVTGSRPYMQARYSLAGELEKLGRYDEAVSHYEAMLDLNHMDNLGARYQLMGCYLLQKQLGGVRWLFESCPDEYSAIFSWARVLERHLSEDLPGARSALAVACDVNAHVSPYLTGRKRLPRHLPACYSPGEVSEAIICASILKPAWRRYKAAMTWLKSYQDGPKVVR